MALIKIFRGLGFFHPFIKSKLNAYHTNRFLGLRHRSNIIYEMNTIYFRNIEGDNAVDVKFVFENNLLNIKAEFNFKRNLTETLNDLCWKVNNRIEKLVEKKAKKKKGVEMPKVDISSSFLLNDQPLAENTLIEDIFSNKLNGNLKLRVIDSEYNVSINSPSILSIQLPKELRVGTVIFPVEFEVSCTEIENCEFQWYKSLKPPQWLSCGNEFFYTSNEDDVNHFLKVVSVPKKGSEVGPAYEVETQMPFINFPEADEIRKRHEFTKTPVSDNEIRIVSYNILADSYVHTKEAKTSLFTYCDTDILQHTYRKDLFNIELTGYNADLIFLQEADKRIYKRHILPVLAHKGFKDCYHEKPTEGVREGCAFLYKHSKFKLHTVEQHGLTEAVMNTPYLSDLKECIISNEKLVSRLCQVSSQIQVGVLECLTQKDHLIVFGNTHLYFHPDADHIRLLQGLTLFRILENTAEKTKSIFPSKNVSIVLCGDFNSTPECGFHQFLREGSVDSSHIDWKSKEDEVIQDVSCSHSLKMKSAYENVPYTNYTVLFKACLDYIYFQTDFLELQQVVPLPSEEVLSQYGGIPSKHFPSDHLSLVADLKYKYS